MIFTYRFGNKILEVEPVREYIEERAIELAQYIIANKSTIRATAKKFNVSKSTVHMVRT